MRRYLQTIYTCGRLLSVSSSTKERKNKKDVWMILEKRKSSMWFFVTISITISMSFCFFSRCYSCHPCFLLYYSISEWCQVLYMVWIYVCKEDMWESVQEDALFLLWNILSLLISKQELCLFFCCGWMPVFNQLEEMQKCGQGVEYVREKRLPVLVRPCASVGIQWLKHGNFIVNVHTAAFSTAMTSTAQSSM